MPHLRKREGSPLSTTDEERTQLLAEKFFPQAPTAVIASDTQPNRILTIPPQVTAEEVQGVINGLPKGKTPGPNGIPNEVLRAINQEISQPMAAAISRAFAYGALPASYKESITLALRKGGKKDYSLPSSYRPIALENTLAKVVEKVLANRIAIAAEEHGLLPWNQMGARKDRSTLSAISLLTTCVESAWKAHPGCVVSMLSLDIAGAFDNVPHAKLLWILEKKGFPTWLVNTIASFLYERRTRIAYAGYESDWIHTNTGIPQGSPLSPILFLIYISGLLEKLQTPDNDTLGFGFVDDTNIIAWGVSAEDNCRRLNAAHSQCEDWAEEHGAKFAPDKYQLIHFTRGRKQATEAQASSIRFGDYIIQPESTAIRVLGVWLDPKLT